MASTNTPGPTETTSLLQKPNTVPIDSSLTSSIDPKFNDNGVSTSQHTNTDDEENGELEQPENPLFEGQPEMAQKMYLLFPAVALGIFLSAADQTIIVSSYGRIGSELNALNNSSWIATAYFLTLTSVQPLYGKLSDIFGRKPCLLFSYTVFGLGCLFCGLARNFKELVAARAFAGIGGGGMATVVSILLSDIIPLRNRGTWQGYVNIVYAAGASAGAPLGGLLSDNVGWRWAFLIQFPMTLVASCGVYFVLSLPSQKSTNRGSKLRQIDFMGAFTLIFAVFALLIGLDRGSNVSWSQPITIISMSLSIPLFAIFVYVEMKIASHPFAPGHIIFSRNLVASYLNNFFAAGAYMGTIFYVPLYFQAVDGMSATQAGIRLIPGLVCSVSGSLFGGIYMKRTGRYYWLTIICSCFCICGATIVFLSSGLLVSESWVIIIGLGFTAFGAGAVITTTLINVIANADSKDQAVATACTYLFRSLGSVVGVSVSATIVQQRLRTLLREKLDGSEADEIVAKVRQSLDFIKTLDGKTKDIVISCYERATNASFGMGLIIVVLALVSTCFMREAKLSK